MNSSPVPAIKLFFPKLPRLLLVLFLSITCQIASAQSFEEWNNQAHAAFQKKDYALAIADYTKALELKQDDPWTYMYRGMTYFNMGNYDLAIGDYAKSLELKPDNFMIYSFRASAYSQRKESDLAIADLSKALELKPDDVMIYFSRGEEYFRKKEYDQAIADFSKVIEFKPKEAEFYRERGNAYAARGGEGDSDRAVADLKKAIEIDPKMAQYIANNIGLSREIKEKLGLTVQADTSNSSFAGPSPEVLKIYKDGEEAMKKNDFDGEIAIYTKGIELYPNEAGFYLNRGGDYYFKDQYDLAIADYNKAIELEPDHAMVAYLGRGKVYGGKGDLDQAIMDISKAIEIKPDYSHAFRERGMVYAKRAREGDAELSLSDLIKAIELDRANSSLPKEFKSETIIFKTRNLTPEMAAKLMAKGYGTKNAVKGSDLNYWRSEAGKDHQKGNLNQAIMEYTKVLELKPDDVWAIMQRGNCHFFRNNFDMAIQDYTKVISLTPNDKYVYYSRGSCYKAEQNYNEAIADYSKTIEIRPENPFSYSDQGLCYVRRGAEGDSDKATADFQKAVSMDISSVKEILDGTKPLPQEWKDKIQAMVDAKKGKANPQ